MDGEGRKDAMGLHFTIIYSPDEMWMTIGNGV